MRIVMISDTHNQYPDVPEGDLLLHGGDLTMRGTAKEIEKAGNWLRGQGKRFSYGVITIAGNHDFLFEENLAHALDALGGGIHYLENTGMIVNGMMIFGSPVSPWFMDWAFNVQRGAAIRKVWDKIPYDLDVLITHGPPRGILDQTAPHLNSEHLGCDDLLMAVHEKQPRIHVFGHIHGGYGSHKSPVVKTQFYNAAYLNEAYKPANEPWVVDLEPK